MPVLELKRLTDWQHVLSAARTTRGSKETSNTPTPVWKQKILIAEHSPIRFLEFTWVWEIPYWVSVHFIRHKFGIEHWVKSQRPERDNGETLQQNAIVKHKVKANAQAIINISKDRLCACAAEETRKEWAHVIEGLRNIREEELVKCCVPKCCYRGLCPESRHNCKIGEYYWNMYRQFIKDADMRIFQ